MNLVKLIAISHNSDWVTLPGLDTKTVFESRIYDEGVFYTKISITDFDTEQVYYLEYLDTDLNIAIERSIKSLCMFDGVGMKVLCFDDFYEMEKANEIYMRWKYGK